MPTSTNQSNAGVNATTNSPWLTREEAAAYTKLSTATITRARKTGDLRGYKVQGKKLWRFHVSDLDRWMQKGAAA